MKQFFLILLLISSLGANAQTEDFSGTYVFYNKSLKGEIVDYKIQLNKDQTFIFTSYVYNGLNEYRSNGKGTWKVENKTLKFTTEPADINKEYTLNFTGTTARVIKKSPRDTSDKVVPTALQFYKSEIRIIENLKLLLKE
ncbi:MAG: hypothetical protein C0525_09400 [Flavobacterium sp.]|jgi:hypothetical protein|uniref:DUF5004 domain-containing protein n=1 Tax=Flavobacterium sp. TaxID=239 RepID=UPI0025C737F4|nr:DUF5004 domain-containing protein [Flavobacterium sp.]MBA4134927.1 hypothetical protein [Flavobacterium sp.]